ncbi:hypothetical protein EV360DRAFT_75491 [Lentinula raphanica]|nr:hypothetical protein EV360DRAFT_75491 [Lentinula raphanica]
MSTDHCFEFSGSRATNKPTLVRYPTLSSFVEFPAVKCEENSRTASPPPKIEEDVETLEDRYASHDHPSLPPTPTTKKVLRSHSPLTVVVSEQKARLACRGRSSNKTHQASHRHATASDVHERIYNLKDASNDAVYPHPFDCPPAERKTRYREFRTYYYTFRTAQFLDWPPRAPGNAEPFPDNLIFLNISTEQEAAFRPLREADIKNVVRMWIWSSAKGDWKTIEYGDECLVGPDDMAMGLTVRSDLTPALISVKALKAKKAKLVL